MAQIVRDSGSNLTVELAHFQTERWLIFKREHGSIFPDRWLTFHRTRGSLGPERRLSWTAVFIQLRRWKI